MARDWWTPLVSGLRKALDATLGALGVAWHVALEALWVAWLVALEALAAIWRLVRPPLVFALQVVAALILLFEEWGWRPLVALLDALARFKVWARLELIIAGLPPYAALAALALPTSLLLPLKFVAVYLLANGQALSAALLFLGAKVVSTALIARLFLLTKPALMRIGWFRRAHDWLVPWQEAMFALIRSSWVWRYGRMVKERVRLETKRLWLRLRPQLVATWHNLRPRLAGLWLRLRASAAGLWARIRLPRLPSTPGRRPGGSRNGAPH